MSVRGTRFHPDQPGPRHDPGWYDQSGEAQVLEPGDRVFIHCDAGPSAGRIELWPPRLEIPDRGGTYALLDVGPRSEWSYHWVPTD